MGVWVFRTDGTELPECETRAQRYGARGREQWHWDSFQFPHLVVFPSLRVQAAYAAIGFFSLLCPFLERMELDSRPWHGKALFSFPTQTSLSLLPPTSHSPTLLDTIHQWPSQHPIDHARYPSKGLISKFHLRQGGSASIPRNINQPGL